MSRRNISKKRFPETDSVYNSYLVSLLITRILKSGKKTIAKKIVYDAFEIIQKKTNDDPLKVFAALDIVIMPTTNEAFGRTLIEAMSQSTAIIASNSGGHLEIIEEWKNGIFWNGTEYYKVNNVTHIEKWVKGVKQ